MTKFPRPKRCGFAIPLAMLTILLLLAAGVALLSVGLNSRVYAMRTASDIAARCAADAGLAIALHEMNEKLEAEPWDDSILPQATDVNLPYSEGIYSYNVTGDLGSGYIITSNGECDHIRKFVRATIGLQGLFEHAILTKSMLILKAGTSIDGYNSQDPSDTDADVDIGTQSTSASSIVLNTGVTVNGDVIVGMGGDPSTVIKDLGATTTGLQYPGTAQEPLPQITAPTDLFDKHMDINVQGQTTVLTPADNGQYSQIILKQGTVPAKLEITGGDVIFHITGDIQLGQSCEIVVKDGSTLTLYVDGNIHCRESSGINPEYPTQQVQTLQVYGTGQDTQLFDLKAKSQWTGVVYAPNATVNLYAGGDVYGAFVADTFEFKAGGDYHYDEALREVQMDDEEVRFVVVRWEEGNLD